MVETTLQLDNTYTNSLFSSYTFNEGYTGQEYERNFTFLHSLPNNLAFKQSRLHTDFYGIWSLENITRGTRFGPYMGFISEDAEEEKIAEVKNKQKADDTPSNWLEYLNHALSEEQQNLLLFKFQEQMYYISCTDIPPNTELLVGYRDENGWIRMNIANETNEFYKVSHASYKPYECDMRGMELMMQRYLQTAFHTDTTSCECDQYGNESAIDFNSNIHTGGAFSQGSSLMNYKSIHASGIQYKCTECGKTFAQSKYLRRHKEIHTEGKLYECDECGKTFAQDKYLKKHKVFHSGQKPYECDLCGKAFAQNTDLKRHRRIHTGEKPYQCDLCGKEFSENKGLKRHRTLHTGVKPYKCDECGKSFVLSPDLKSHQRRHTGEKPFECSVCKKKFAQRKDLKSHEKIHSNEKPHKCDICGKAFIQNAVLKIHQRIHTGERPFECELCGKKFSQNKNLKRHRMLHSGERPFECDECGKKFAQNKNLKRHKMIHNKKS